MTKYFPEEILKALGVCIVALIIWFPLKPYGQSDFLFGFNWIAGFLGLNCVFIVKDFINFKHRQTKFRHYILGALLCPIWLIARYFVLDET